MTKKESFDAHGVRAVKNHWWLYLLLVIIFLLPSYLIVTFHGIDTLSSQFTTPIYLLDFAFAIGIAHGTALVRTKFTKEERQAIKHDIKG